MHHNINLRRAAERVRGRCFQREPFREIHTLREFGHCHLTAALLDRHGSKEDSFRWRSSLELGEMWRAISATLDSEEWRRLLLQFSVLVALEEATVFVWMASVRCCRALRIHPKIQNLAIRTVPYSSQQFLINSVVPVLIFLV